MIHALHHAGALIHHLVHLTHHVWHHVVMRGARLLRAGPFLSPKRRRQGEARRNSGRDENELCNLHHQRFPFRSFELL